MESGVFISSTGHSAAPSSSALSSEIGQGQQRAQSKGFGALFKDAIQNSDDQPTPASPELDVQAKPVLLTETDSQGTGVAVSQGQELSTEVYPTSDKAEPSQCQTEECSYTDESMIVSLYGYGVIADADDRTVKTEFVLAGSPKPSTADASIDSPLQPVSDLDHVGETLARPEGSRSVKELPIRNDRNTSPDASPRPLEQPVGGAALFRTLSPGLVSSNYADSSGVENQETTGVLSPFPVIGNEAFGRLSTGIQTSVIVQTQGTQGASSLSQTILVPAIGESGEEGQDSSGVDAQGAGEGAFLSFGESEDQESMGKSNLSPFFSTQFTSVKQGQIPPQGSGGFVGTPAADHLKMTQALLGENHSAAIMSASGKTQAVQLELPSHDSGPLSVRISMTDQRVHAQFTTDRNDLGAVLMGRQDQLQQNLIKTGLELGQFQVHIDQRSQQEALPDRQSRQNGEALEQQPSQDHDQSAQDRIRPDARPLRTLSLFA